MRNLGQTLFRLSEQLLAKSKSSSSNQWLQRQSRDVFTREAKIRQYKSRAAFKLKDMHKKYRLFKPGMTVVDLGFAPGAWSQVAVEETKNQGRVFGVDILLCQPPPGVTSIQGNFLSPGTQNELKRMISDVSHGKTSFSRHVFADQKEYDEFQKQQEERENPEPLVEELSYLNLERELSAQEEEHERKLQTTENTGGDKSYPVDIVLSDMCDPWPQDSGFWLRSVNDPYVRMQNTSGLPVKDHAMSIDLCDAALVFAIDMLKPGGKFVCKFYAGSEDKYLERRLKKVFRTVKRDKPEASRKESREMYFVGLDKKNVTRNDVFGTEG